MRNTGADDTEVMMACELTRTSLGAARNTWRRTKFVQMEAGAGANWAVTTNMNIRVLQACKAPLRILRCLNEFDS